MTRVIVDASVAAKWVIDEVHTDCALRVLDEHDVAAPSLIYAEVASALVKAVKREEMSAEEASFKMVALVRAELETVPDEHLCARAISLAARLDHSVYDCFYLALAAAEEVPLVTADRKLLSIARSGRLDADVVWIGDVR